MPITFSGDGTIKPPKGFDGVQKSESTANPKKTESTGNSFASALEEAGMHGANPSAPANGLTPRAQKIQALKAQIANGSYNPDALKVSEKLISFISDNLV